MGHVILTFKNHTLLVRDQNLNLIIRLIIDRVEEDQIAIQSSQVNRLLNHWQEEKNYYYGPGVMDLNLEWLENNSEVELQEFVDILDKLIEKLQDTPGESSTTTVNQLRDLLLEHRLAVPRPSAAICFPCESGDDP